MVRQPGKRPLTRAVRALRCGMVGWALVMSAGAAMAEAGSAGRSGMKPTQTGLTDIGLSEHEYPVQTATPVPGAAAQPTAGAPADRVVEPEPVQGPALDQPEIRTVWRQRPLAIDVRVNQWRVLHLPPAVPAQTPSTPGQSTPGQAGEGAPAGAVRVEVAVERRLQPMLTVETAGRSVHLLASKAFKGGRLVLQEGGGAGRTFEFYVTATRDGEPVGNLTLLDGVQAGSEDAEEAFEGYDWVQLTRYPLQVAYLPPRLVERPEHLREVKVRRRAVPLVIRGAVGAEIEAVPVQAWTDGFHYVTQVRLENKSNWGAALDPRVAFGGQWVASALYSANLAQAGTSFSATTAAFVSTAPFQEALDGR